MADNITAPAAGTTLATKDLAGVHYPKNVITDQAGADVIGLLTASPDANSLLGRLKAIVDALSSVTVDGSVELGASSLAALETIELGATTLAALENINATVSGSATEVTLAAILAKLIAAPSTAANQATLIGHVDGIEAALANLGTQTTLAAILAKIIAAPATEAKQDAAITAINGLVGTEYETVAAASSDQPLGASGAIGDLLVGVLIVPATTSPGAVSIKDGAGTAITVFAGGASSVTTLHPFFVPLNIKCSGAGWKVTTGVNVSAIGVGNFV